MNLLNTTESGTHHWSMLFLYRNCSPSSKPLGGSSGPRGFHAVSAAQAYAKLIQERNLGDFKNNQLLFINQLQENLVKDQNQLEQHQTQVCLCSSVFGVNVWLIKFFPIRLDAFLYKLAVKIFL